MDSSAIKLGMTGVVLSLALTACGQGGGPASSIESATSVVNPPGAPPTGAVSPPAPTPPPTMPPGPTPPPIATPPATNTGDPNCVDKTSDPTTLRAQREEVCALVNVERAKVGAKPLVLEPIRSDVAQSHAEDMVARQYFSHTSPEGDGPDDRLRGAGVGWTTWGENIALNSGTPASVVSQWMNSSGHRANILNANFGRLGVGRQSSHWVQVFTN